jgi:hypothetical protein
MPVKPVRAADDRHEERREREPVEERHEEEIGTVVSAGRRPQEHARRGRRSRTRSKAAAPTNGASNATAGKRRSAMLAFVAACRRSEWPTSPVR